MSAPQGAPAAQPPQASPAALAVADFLKNQDLKCRTCILSGQRKELFKVKRAIRALQSEAYTKACQKNTLLPKVSSPLEAAQAFSLLPRSLLALRVSKIDPASDGHSHGKPAKRVKGLWTVKIEQQQEIRDDLYYTWFYEPRSWKQTIMGVGVLMILFIIVLFPLWPPQLRLGVWYLSIGMLWLIGLFILMSIFRLILFLVTTVVLSPGLWLYPNLFEDVGFFDSFKPLWAWHKVKGAKKKKAAGSGEKASTAPVSGEVAETSGVPAAAPTVSTSPASAPPLATGPGSRPKPTVEEE